jgi:hypothetical protein
MLLMPVPADIAVEQLQQAADAWRDRGDTAMADAIEAAAAATWMDDLAARLAQLTKEATDA